MTGRTEMAPAMHAGPAMVEAVERQEFDAFRAQIEDPGALQILDYWSGLVNEHGLRIKNRIDPLAYAPLLEHVYLEEWDPFRQESKVRLQGEALRALWGGNVVGQAVSEQVAGKTAIVWQRSDECCFLQNRPTLCYYNLAHRGRGYYWVWDLALPMQDDKGRSFALGYVWQDPART